MPEVLCGWDPRTLLLGLKSRDSQLVGLDPLPKIKKDLCIWDQEGTLPYTQISKDYGGVAFFCK